MSVTYLFLNNNCLLVLLKLQEYLTSQIFGEIFFQKSTFYKVLFESIAERRTTKMFASSTLVTFVS